MRPLEVIASSARRISRRGLHRVRTTGREVKRYLLEPVYRELSLCDPNLAEAYDVLGEFAEAVKNENRVERSAEDFEHTLNVAWAQYRKREEEKGRDLRTVDKQVAQWKNDVDRAVEEHRQTTSRERYQS